MQVLPDDETGGGINQPPSLEFKMDIKTPGIYRLFARWDGNQDKSGSSDSLFVDVIELKDGLSSAVADWYELVRPISGDFSAIDWDGTGGFEKNDASPMRIPTEWQIQRAGIYTLRFSQREDGAAIDAFVFQLSTLPAPTGRGPATSATYVESILTSWGLPVSDVIDQLLDFGEYSYPDLFPGRKPTATFGPYLYRYYPETGIYLGVANGVAAAEGLVEGGVYVMGGPFASVPRLVGNVSDFVAPVPSRLAAAPELSAAYLSSLPTKPVGVGAVCANRAAWDGTRAKVAALVAQADALLGQPFPVWNESTYLAVSETGSRASSTAMLTARSAWLYPLVIAECATWQGKYLAAIRTTLRELALQPSWNYTGPGMLDAYMRGQWLVDLSAADMAHELAQSIYMLGDKLDNETRKVVHDALEARVFKPMRDTFDGTFVGGFHWWLTSTNNWNAVCLKGVVGAALAALPSRHDRARFAAAGEFYSRYFMSGFPDSGYSTEGPSYWGFGVGRYTVLRSMLYAASGGAVDLLASPKAQAVGLYASRIEMTPAGNIAAISDAGLYPLDMLVRAYMMAAYGTPSAFPGQLGVRSQTSISGGLVETAMLLTESVPQAVGFATSLSEWPGTSSYFSDAGILVTRSPFSAPVPLAATIKSGGSGNHGHDDVGSYTIALGAEQPIGDVGGGQYTDKTFSDQRRTIKWVNSYGHPVPLVGGRKQIDATGAKNAATSLRLADAEDEIAINMAPAYALPEGWVLTRTLQNNRTAGAIVVSDGFSFSVPQDFEVAITTLGQWRQTSASTLELWQKSLVLNASIEASAPFSIAGETIEDDGLTFQRIAVRLQAPASTGWVRVTYQH